MIFFASRLMLIPVIFICITCRYNQAPDAVPAANWQILYDSGATSETAEHAGDWRPITIPSKFKLPYKPKRDYQYSWLRATFHINGNPSQYYGIHLGRVYYLDRVYINGRLIGERTAGDAVSIHYPRNYPIPGNTMMQGANIMHVRLGVYGNKYGGITDTAQLLDKTSFNRTREYDNFIYHHAPLAIAILLIGMLIFFIIFLIWSRDRGILIIIAFLALGIMLIISDILSMGFFSHDIRLTIKDSILTIVSVLCIFICQWYYHVYLPKLNKGLAAYLLLAMAATWSNLDTTSEYYLAEIISNTTMFLAFVAGIYTLAYAHSVKPDRTKLILYVIFIMLPCVIVLFEVIEHYFMSGFAKYSGIGFIIIYMAVFMAILARNVINREIELRVLYHDLRIHAKSGSRRQPSEKDERINAVIEFIRNNFMSDLSREGLAASIDISTDYLSKKFNAVTGKRIDEYINELRVNQAATMLCETDRKIIDIAFSVGFESLSTFNRLFLKQMGMPPKYYRRKNRVESA